LGQNNKELQLCEVRKCLFMQPTLEALPRTFDVFLSHNSSEKEAVEALATKLRDDFGLKPWFDKWHLQSGSVWQDKLDEGLRSSRACAIFLGPSGITPWQLQEMRVAQVLHAEQQPFQVIPVILPGGDGKNFPLFIRSNFNWIDFRNGLDNPVTLKQLAQSITGETEPPSHSEFGSDVCPFKGLDAYKEEDAEFFFGREIFVEQRLVEHLRQSRFLAVVGMSGSGKSSVVRAGLIPALKRGALLGKETAPIITMKPGSRPLEELAVQLLALLPGMSLRQIIDDLKSSERSLHLAFRQMTAARHLFLIDQFEELFTQTTDEEERQAFFKNLVYAATLSDSPLLIVITMRSDFLSKCAQYRDVNSLICENFEQVPYMTPDELRRAIIEPAKRAELKFQMGLVDLIMKEIDSSANNLPLLQHTLLELWQRRRENQLSTTVYHELGGVHGSLAQHAERVFTQLAAEQQAVVQRMFMRLVTLGEGTEDTRRRATKAELLSFGEGASQAIELLVKHRLLTAATDPATQDETIEVVHEALIRGWPRLAGWIDQDRDFNRFRQKLTSDAEEWNTRGRSETEVYRGGHLEEGEGYLQSRAKELTPLEQDFIRAGIVHHEAEIEKEKKRFKFLRRLFIVAVIGFIGAGVAAYVANNLRKVSHSKEIGLRVIGMPDEDPQTLLTMAIDAYETSPTDEAQEALRLAVREANAKQVLRGFRGDLYDVVYSPDHRLLASFSTDSSIRLWDVATGALRTAIKAPFALAITGLNRRIDLTLSDRFSADGKYIWAHSDSGIAVWSSSDGALVRMFTPNSSVQSAALSADGKRMVAGFQDSTARIMDVATDREVWRTHNDSGRVTEVFFNRDASRILLIAYGTSRFRYRPYEVRLLDGATYKTIATLQSNSRRMTTMARFSPDGKHIATYYNLSGLEGIDHPEQIPIMEVWDAVTGKLEYRINDCSDWELNCFGQFSENGKYLIVGRNANAVIYDGTTGSELHWLRGHQNPIVRGQFFDSDRYVMTFSDDKTTRIWETATGSLVSIFRGHRSTTINATVASDGSSLVTYGGDSTVWLYRQNPLGDFNYNAELFAARFDSPVIHEGETIINDSGLVTLFPYWSNHVQTFNVSQGKELPERPLSDGFAYLDYNAHLKRAAFTQRDGGVGWLDVDRHTWSNFGSTQDTYSEMGGLTLDNTRVVTGNITYDWALFEKGKKVIQLSDKDRPAQFATISPDGKRIVLMRRAEHITSMIDATTGTVIQEWKKDHVGAPVYDPTGSRLLMTSQRNLEVCDINGKILGTFPGSYTSSLDMSGDGRYLVLACRDKTVSIINMQNAKIANTIKGAENDVNVVAISRDGSKVIACEKNGTCEVWETLTGKRIAVLRGYKGTVQNAIFSPDGRLISTRGTRTDGSCRVYYTYAEDVLVLAKEKLRKMSL